jgi:hypothetical protein
MKFLMVFDVVVIATIIWVDHIYPFCRKCNDNINTRRLGGWHGEEWCSIHGFIKPHFRSFLLRHR